MPRPKKFKNGWSQWNIMRLHDAEPVYRHSERLALTEGVSVSEIIVKALDDYNRKHGEGNPQALTSYYLPYPHNKPKPPTMEIKSVAKDLRDLLEKYNAGKGAEEYRSSILVKMKRLAVKLEKLNAVVQENEYEALMAEVSVLLGIS